MSQDRLSAIKQALLARRLQPRAAQGDDGQGRQRIPRRPSSMARIPLSFAQQRLWFLEQFDATHSAYNMPAVLRIEGALSVPALRAALAAIVARHEILRTRFEAVEGTPSQCIEPAMDLLLLADELADLAGPEQDARVQALVHEEAGWRFALGTGPLIRARLARLADDAHLLCVTMHHIVSDGWSMGVLVRELGALYAAFLHGQPSPLPALAIQYADFACWQREQLEGLQMQRQLDHWTAALQGAPTLSTLPADRPRPAVQRFRGRRLDFTVPVATVAALRGVARSAQASLFMVLAAAFNVLLSRHAGQSDLCIGTPIANRTQADTEALVGFFINTLVLRTRIDRHASFATLLQQVRATTLAAYAHQDLPFDRLVEVLKPARQSGHAPLFQVLLTLQNAPDEPLALPGLRIAAVALDPGVAKFDLTLDVAEVGEQLLASFEYDTDLFDAATIERLSRHLLCLLEGIGRDPQAAVRELPMLAGEERAQLLDGWNRTRAEFVPERGVHQRVEDQARRRPQAIAVQSPEGVLSYGELNARANQLARHLRACGVVTDQLVGLSLERSADMAVALLAILKAGGAYLPLDAALPAERLARMLDDGGAHIVLTQSDLLEHLPLDGRRGLCIDTLWADVQHHADDDLGLPLHPDQLAYALFTSGSTGQPKAVATSHRNVARLVADDDFEVGEDARVLQFAPLGFDASTFEIWTTLTRGACLVMAAPGPHALSRLGRLIVRERVEVLWLTGALFNQMVDHELPSLAAVRHLLAGGEALSPRHVRRFLDACPGARLTNGYGPTESTTFACCHRFAADETIAAPVPIGRPIRNTRAYILDADLQPVPVGTVGELYLGGDGLARGYLRDAGRTAAVFLPDPHGEAGARIYRTGDLARHRADGRIEYQGRIDHQVKLRGFRIEPGEIEQALAALPPVRDAVVLLREDRPGDKRLVAYVVPREGQDAQEAALRAALARTLPDYMVPGHVVLLSALPLTPQGKLDRQALPVPESATPADDAPPPGPRTPTEQVLAAIWREVLAQEGLGIHDDFFERGGHSLLATQVIAKAGAAFGLELPLRLLFDAPSVAALAERIDGMRPHATASADAQRLPAIERVPRDAPLAVSFAQQRMLFLDRLEPGTALYNVPIPVRLQGLLDGAALTLALNELLRRHEVLRTHFETQGDRDVQVVAEQVELDVPLIDLDTLPAAEREARALALGQQEAEAPFDLAHGPLVRATLLRLGSEEHLLLLTLHHIVCDGWSIGVLVREVAALYEAFSHGSASPLPALPVQYADYAAWQRRYLDREALSRQLDHWREELVGAPTLLELPTDRPRPAMQSHRGAIHAFAVPAPTVAALQILGASARATLFMTLSAAFSLLLSRHARQNDVCLGTPIANRAQAELEGLIGFFVNTLVLRTRIDPKQSFIDLLQQVRTTTLAAYANQDLPFEQLVDELKPERHLSHTPLFQVMLGLQQRAEKPPALQGLGVQLEMARSAVTKCDLLLHLAEDGEQLHGWFEYATDLFDAATIERMAGHFTTLLDSIGRQPEARVADLPMLAEAERRLLRLDPPAPRAPADCVHTVFERQAARTPEAAALLFGDAALSYAELNRRANQLAHHLRDLGVQPDDRVVVCVERSAAMVVALLGILKAGAAYVPLDPGYPLDRLALMLADARPAVLLTQQRLRAALPDHAGLRVVLDDPIEALALAANPVHDPVCLAAPANLAYVIYTSGSTGLPKGTLVSHRSVVRLVTEADYVRLGSHTVMAQASNTSFDAATFEIWGALLNGGRLVHLDKEVLLTPVALKSVLRHQGVTDLFVTTALFNRIAQAQPDVFESLDTLLFGGEAVSPRAVSAVLGGGHPPKRLLHVYGPTETTTFASWSQLGAVPADGAPIPIGDSLAGSRLYVLDGDFNPLPVGLPGQLFIAGDGLARGYLGRADLTAERFLPDPHGAPGARMYASGDHVRRLADGQVEYLGRIDRQVKLRGFRIEPGEIEAALLALPRVGMALVRTHQDGAGERSLVAYVQPRGDAPVSSPDLRAALSAVLPEYMVPAHLVVVDAFALTPNGKIDQARLPAPDTAARETGFVAPRSATEKALAPLWADVLGLEAVGVHDNFFALGGHSLRATQLVSQVRAVLGRELALRALFEAPTLAELARRLDADGTVPAMPPLAAVPRDRPLRTSFGQQRLLFLDRLVPGTALYNVPVPVRLGGALDVAALGRALDELVRRHEVLRTRFVAQDEGQSVQVIADGLELPLPLVDLSALSVAEREAQADALSTQEAAAPFDLAESPLLRTRLLRLAAEEHLLLLTLHHIVCDGWSIGVLVREVAALYEAFTQDRPSPLPALPLQYADFAEWQRRFLEGETLAQQLRHWREQLAGAPTLLELPTDRPRPAVQRHQGAVHAFAIPASTTEALHRLAADAQATLFMTLAAAFSLLLSRHARQDDVCLGTPIANRTRAEFEGLIGFFVNTLVLRTRIDPKQSFIDLLAQVRGTTLAAYANQDLPFEQLVDELKPERHLSHSPLFQAMIALQNTPTETADLAGLRLQFDTRDNAVAKFDLSLHMVESGPEVHGWLDYDTALFDAATIERLAGHFVTLLAGIARQPRACMAELPMLQACEQAQLARWNDTADGVTHGLCLHTLIERQAARTPDAEALVFGQARLAYAELNARANRLAHRLIALGVGPDTPVGVCADRSTEMVVALLAVLKAGGAYVPLDPAQPAERLALMLGDARPPVVLAQRHLLGELPPHAATTLVLEDEPAAGDAHNPPCRARPANLAYVIYTSGSTGRPKGVAIDHQGIVNRLHWMQRAYALGASDRVLQKTPFGFDVSVWEFFWPLMTGATLVLARPGGHQDLPYLSKLIAEQRITTLHFVPPMLEVFLDGAELPAGHRLRQVMCSGQALPWELQQRFFARLPGVALHNLYGPTEASVDVTAWACDAALHPGRVPIGHAISNLRIHLLDAALNPVPVGVAGELYIAGIGLARGYLARPDLTAERFVPDPHGPAGSRMYATGDLARRLSDGSIDYIGRNDHQVKIRGLRIELGEIEARIAAMPGVRDIVVLAREDVPRDVRLVAYAVQGDPAQAPDIATWRAALGELLPEYMVPSHLVLLERLPLGVNGKLDRRALPAPDAAQASAEHVAPGTPTEQRLAELWGQVLRRERVGIHDNFFDLGGNSLLILQLHARLAAELGERLAVVDLFQHTTVARLARLLDSSEAVDAGTEAAQPQHVARGSQRGEARRNRVISNRHKPSSP